MNQPAMKPYGTALSDYYNGDPDAGIIFRREDGKEVVVPAGYFFRDYDNFSSIEKEALSNCKGRILDIGAGTGSISLRLQNFNYPVTSIDLDPNAVAIMKGRGLKDVKCCDVFEYQGGPFDTLLMMGHGIGMVETIEGLDRFLLYAHNLITNNGQLLADSLDVRKTTDKDNLDYQDKNRKSGRYIGEISMQCEYRGKKGPYYTWLQVDEETFRDHAEYKGWSYETIYREESGDYLAKLTQQISKE